MTLDKAWVAQWRMNLRSCLTTWRTDWETARLTRSEVIDAFGGEYRTMRRRGLARIVRCYTVR
jgi:hypothetical protein